MRSPNALYPALWVPVMFALVGCPTRPAISVHDGGAGHVGAGGAPRTGGAGGTGGDSGVGGMTSTGSGGMVGSGGMPGTGGAGTGGATGGIVGSGGTVARGGMPGTGGVGTGGAGTGGATGGIVGSGGMVASGGMPGTGGVGTGGTVACTAGFANCDQTRPDCETDTTIDPRHCGACNVDCTAAGAPPSQDVKGWKCVSGTCYAVCADNVGGGSCRFIPFIKSVSCTTAQCAYYCQAGRYICGNGDTSPIDLVQGCVSTSSMCSIAAFGTKEL